MVLERLDSPESVLAGPFVGMRYGPHTADKALLSRLLGRYEKETYAAVERIIAGKPDIVAVAVAGAGEGFFAVGMALRLPGARVVAFELSRWGRYLTARHARRNGVAGRVVIRERCSPETLKEVLSAAARPALICDIEGSERTVLDPEIVPELAKTTMLVELHPMYVEGIEKLLTARFSATHEISVIHMQERRVPDLPAACRDRLAPQDALWAVDEVMFRGPVGLWMLLLPGLPEAVRQLPVRRGCGLAADAEF